MIRKPHHKGFKVKHIRLRRRRAAISRLGKKGKAWESARRKLKIEFAAIGITSCELRYEGCTYDDYLSFAHSAKRRKLSDYDLKHTVIVACFACHDKIERMSAEGMERIVLETIDNRRRAA